MGGPHHVFTRCYPLSDTLVQLWSLSLIPTFIPLIQVTKVSRGCFIKLCANVTTPSPSIFKPSNIGINICPTTFTTNDTGSSRLDNVDFFLLGKSRGKGKENTSSGYFALSCQCGSGREFRSGGTKHAFGDCNVKVHIVNKVANRLSRHVRSGLRLPLRESVHLVWIWGCWSSWVKLRSYRCVSWRGRVSWIHPGRSRRSRFENGWCLSPNIGRIHVHVTHC